MLFVPAVVFNSLQSCCVHHQNPEGQWGKLTQTTAAASGKELHLIPAGTVQVNVITTQTPNPREALGCHGYQQADKNITEH